MHHDPAVRARAEQRALAWDAVLTGMASGTLDVGSRTPVADTPAWVTLEVVHGGFATGRSLAEVPLDDAEEALLARVPATVTGSTDRGRLNRWFLTDEGLAELERALLDGSYVVDVPEHAALLVVAWLLASGHDAAALELVAVLHPWMDRLRFAPILGVTPPASVAVVHVRTVGEVADRLRSVRTPQQVLAMDEALVVWRPLYDRLVDLWLATVEDDWPCRRRPADWSTSRQQWLDGYAAASSTRTICSDHLRPRSNFAILRAALDACPHDSSSLTGRDVGRVRMVLRRSVERHGAPGSDRLQELRARQAGWAARPTHALLASAVADRLASLPRDAGLGDPSAVLRPVDVGGRAHDVPFAIARKVERARAAPVEDLVASGAIPSSEVLAKLLPQVTAYVASASFADPSLRQLYARLYASFRRRRSLLLLDLEHQVRIEELPWVQAIEPFRVTTPGTVDRASRTLQEVTLLAWTSFPQTILPNSLVRELSSLARQARIDIPFVEEVAADIFMGTFTRKWREAAVLASAALSGTLYARYYDLPTVWSEEPARDPQRGFGVRWRKPTADDFARVCGERAREAASGDGSHVARNGTILEQSQILTTHNLAPLVERLALHDEVRLRSADLAVATFAWIVREQNTDYRSPHSRLQMVKNTAYALRQAIFFLSFAPSTAQVEAVEVLRSLAASRPEPWRRRFAPVVLGLEAVVYGARFDPSGRTGEGRRLLGWSVGPHWLLA